MKIVFQEPHFLTNEILTERGGEAEIFAALSAVSDSANFVHFCWNFLTTPYIYLSNL